MITFNGEFSFAVEDIPELLRFAQSIENRGIRETLHEMEDRRKCFEERLEKFMAQLDDALATLVLAVQNDTTVEQSVLTFVQGVPGLITAAVAEALAAGATPAQLQAITDAAATLNTNGAAITAAIKANTPGGSGVVVPALKP